VNTMRRTHNDSEGQTVVEYALVIGLVSLVLTGTLSLFASDLLAWIGIQLGLA